MIDYGGGLKQTTQNHYDDWADASHWMLGRLDATTVIHEAGGSNVVRSSAFDYDPNTGLLSQETIEPGDAQFELITDYYYDGFGNITNQTLSPAELPSRTVLSVDYDAKGRFVELSRNALGHETVFVNDQETGKPLSSTDPNELTTHWRYDQARRLIYEKRPDGSTTTNEIIWDYATTFSISNIVQSSVYKRYTESSGAPPVTAWFDKQGREIRVQTQSADGRIVNKDTGYNALLQAVAVSDPYFAGDSPVYTFSEYDALSRPTLTIAPDGTQAAFGYHGLTTSVTNNFGATDGPVASRNQITSTTKNVKGDVVFTSAGENPLFGVQYSHDPIGNLTQTSDPAGNTIEMRYDLRGNKRWQDDPDMGEWSYTYNALDQLTSQTDANGNVIETAFDLLGRAIARTNWVMKASLELESTAAWFYDGTDEGCKLGALRREEHRDALGAFINRKTYGYDALSRPMLELRNYDSKWFYTTLQYDQLSRVLISGRYWRPAGMEGAAHNLSPTWNSFTTINTYNPLGALTKVVDKDGTLWWQCDASDYDEQGRLTGYEYGNGLRTENTFNSLTGRMEGTEILDGVMGVSDYQFQYDRLGNLTQRSLIRATTLTETCTYDSLNRLVNVDGASRSVDVVYNALGNIENRTDTGTYLYNSSPPPRRHLRDLCVLCGELSV